MKAKLTEELLRQLTLQHAGTKVDVFDDHPRAPVGFGVRMNKAPTYFVRRKVDGHRARVVCPLGSFPKITLADGRRWAESLSAPPAPHQCPDGYETVTLGVAWHEFEHSVLIPKYGHLSPNRRKYYDNLKRGIGHFLDLWTAEPLTALTKARVSRQLDELFKTETGHVTNGAHNALRCLLNWAMNERQYIEHNPAAGLRRRYRPPMRARRGLTPEQVRDAWTATEEMAYPFGPFFALSMLVGGRRTNVAEMRWSELHGETWVIEGELTKNGEPMQILLPRQARTLVAALPRFRRGDYVFSSTEGEKPISGFARANERLYAGAGFKFTPHQFRHTMATYLAERLVDARVVDMMLNHRSGTAATLTSRVYSDARHQQAMRESWQAWADYIDECRRPRGPKVVPLRPSTK